MQSNQEDLFVCLKELENRHVDSFESELEESTCETKRKSCFVNKIRPESVSGLDILNMIIEIKNEIKELEVKFRRHKEILEALDNDNQFIAGLKTKLKSKEKTEPGLKTVRWLCFW